MTAFAHFLHIPGARWLFVMVLSWIVMAGIVIWVLTRSVAYAGETCIFDATFNRWECCRHVMHHPSGHPVCAPSQPVRLLNNA